MNSARRRMALVVSLGLALVCASGVLSPLAPDVSPSEFARRVGWVSRNAAPLLTDDPRAALSDLEPLRKIVGGAHIVALGEGTHGTREFFRLKHRIVKYLVTRMGFRLFSIEANMPEAYRLNDYVLTGHGDPQQLLRSLRFWAWNTQELLDLVEWMREVNQSGQYRVQFTGFDMQNPDSAMATVRRFVARVDSGALPQLDEAWRQARRASLQASSFIPASRELPEGQAAGHHIRFGGWIRTERLEGGRAGLWWRASDAAGRVLVVDTMEGRGPSGTTPWTHFEVDLQVPEPGTKVRFGMLMSGRGTAWFDSLSVEIDGRPWKDEGVDFDFEGPSSSEGWWAHARGYESRLDSTVARFGRRSFLLASVPAMEDSQAAAARAALPAVQGLVTRLELDRARYVALASAAEVDWVIQNGMIVRQCLEVRAGLLLRDQCMARNVDWILSHSPPGTRVALWAHNAHVARQAESMGGYLYQRHGADLVTLGFAFHAGQYNAVNGDRVRANEAVPSVAGSAESVFHATGIPRFLLDLRKASKRDPDSAWLNREVIFRSIGTIAKDGFHVADIHQQYDAVVFVDRGTPSTLLP